MINLLVQFPGDKAFTVRRFPQNEVEFEELAGAIYLQGGDGTEVDNSNTVTSLLRYGSAEAPTGETYTLLEVPMRYAIMSYNYDNGVEVVAIIEGNDFDEFMGIFSNVTGVRDEENASWLYNHGRWHHVQNDIEYFYAQLPLGH